ncbi:hypothetical protein EXIGLDRAFT_733672 [Exidia glandulosa HHB12029]|uniref:Uncharacterized protein n=1 Tax=Exidia glandulosa HHB12029 TaxID=1314781 RepID=A0A165B8J2_EXIGL|nr:hypothetical protein EXIGLDRAFT_733672 [Exidia glandulosa HHB12029]
MSLSSDVPRKRARAADDDETVDLDKHDFPAVDYSVDVLARTMDDLTFESSLALQFEHGGLALDDPEPLPNRESIPKYDYAKGYATTEVVAEDESSAILADSATLESFLDADFSRPSARKHRRPPGPRLTAALIEKTFYTDLFLDTTHAVRGNGLNGQGWTRSPETNYLFGSETSAALRPKKSGPNVRTEGRNQPSLPRWFNTYLDNHLIPYAFSKWPSTEIDVKRADELRYAFHNGYIFYTRYLHAWLVDRASAEVKPKERISKGTTNLVPAQPPKGGAKEFLDWLLEDPDHSRKRVVLQAVKAKLLLMTQPLETSTDIGYALHFSNELDLAVRAVRKIGERARSCAIWVRVLPISKGAQAQLEGKVIAETQLLADRGIERGAFKKTAVVVVDSTWNRIERPDPDDPRLRSLLIWEATGPNDFTPTMDKVVSGIIYNAHVLQKLTTEFQRNHDEDLHASAIESLRTHQAIGRGVIDNGGTIKLPAGHHVVNGQLQSAPFAAALQSRSILSHASFRRKYEERRDVSQLLAFELLSTFLPHFAERQQRTCHEAGLLTPFGTPAYQCFGSWGYFSSSHVDADDGATSADVTERGENVMPDSSNFYLTPYKLILELAHKARWFWDAQRTAHGTTLCYPSAVYPAKWKLFAGHEDLRSTGQITSAFAMTKSAVLAAKRSLA